MTGQEETRSRDQRLIHTDEMSSITDTNEEVVVEEAYIETGRSCQAPNEAP
jgi:hypothetical protein